MDKEYFIKKADVIHDYKYDYSKVVFIKSNVKVIIICPEHGEFQRNPNTHLSLVHKNGCPKCNGLGYKFTTFEKAKEVVAPFKLIGQEAYNKWWIENESYCRKMGLPKHPQAYYKKKSK